MQLWKGTVVWSFVVAAAIGIPGTKNVRADAQAACTSGGAVSSAQSEDSIHPYDMADPVVLEPIRPLHPADETPDDPTGRCGPLGAASLSFMGVGLALCLFHKPLCLIKGENRGRVSRVRSLLAVHC